jgi:hypothetical protein
MKMFIEGASPLRGDRAIRSNSSQKGVMRLFAAGFPLLSLARRLTKISFSVWLRT